jgi:hypothetical protein
MVCSPIGNIKRKIPTNVSCLELAYNPTASQVKYESRIIWLLHNVPMHSSSPSLFHSENSERAAEPNSISRIVVIDAQHDGDFRDVPIRPLGLECCQQDWLILLQSSMDKLGRISEEEDVDAII